jgi:hypothetical protein
MARTATPFPCLKALGELKLGSEGLSSQRGGVVDGGDRVDPFAGLREAGQEYNVYDSHYERIGKVDDLLVDESGRVLYVGVKMGLFGTNSTLVPAEIIRVNDRRRLVEVSEPAETIRHAPHFGKSEELTPELENHVRTYFGLETLRPSPDHDVQGPDITEDSVDRFGPEDQVETVPDERAEALGPSIPASEEPQEGTTEHAESEERVESEEPTDTQEERPQEERPQEEGPQEEHAPERPGSDVPISERLSDEPKGLWDRLTHNSGVTVHRIRR